MDVIVNVVAATNGIALVGLGLVDAGKVEGVDVEGYSDVVLGCVVAVMLAKELSPAMADDRVLFSALYNLK